MLTDKFYEVLENEGIVTIVTWGKEEPQRCTGLSDRLRSGRSINNVPARTLAKRWRSGSRIRVYA